MALQQVVVRFFIERGEMHERGENEPLSFLLDIGGREHEVFLDFEDDGFVGFTFLIPNMNKKRLTCFHAIEDNLGTFGSWKSVGDTLYYSFTNHVAESTAVQTLDALLSRADSDIGEIERLLFTSGSLEMSEEEALALYGLPPGHA